MERFDTLSEVWEAQPAMAQERCGAGAAVIRGRIYVVGGFAGSCVTTTRSVERLDGAWTTVPPMTHPRCLCLTAVIAEKLYVCGGEARRTHITVERFDPTHETWELLRPTLHRRRTPRSPFYVTDCILLAARGDGGVALDAVESYDPETDSWEESTPLLNARSGAKVARVNGCLYVMGGRGQESMNWHRLSGLIPSQGGGRLFPT